MNEDIYHYETSFYISSHFWILSYLRIRHYKLCSSPKFLQFREPIPDDLLIQIHILLYFRPILIYKQCNFQIFLQPQFIVMHTLVDFIHYPYKLLTSFRFLYHFVDFFLKRLSLHFLNILHHFFDYFDIDFLQILFTFIG